MCVKTALISSIATTVILVITILVVYEITFDNSDDIVLYTESMFGGTVHIATFDGNSGSKKGDCEQYATISTELYQRAFKCGRREHVSAMIKASEKNTKERVTEKFNFDDIK